MLRLVLTLLALCALLVLTPAAAGARTTACGNMTVNYAKGRGGASATAIRATGIGCKPARNVVRACLHGRVKRGWRAQMVADRTVYRAHVVLTRGARRITYHPAGGGCG